MSYAGHQRWFFMEFEFHFFAEKKNWINSCKGFLRSKYEDQCGTFYELPTEAPPEHLNRTLEFAIILPVSHSYFVRGNIGSSCFVFLRFASISLFTFLHTYIYIYINYIYKLKRKSEKKCMMLHIKYLVLPLKISYLYFTHVCCT